MSKQVKIIMDEEALNEFTEDLNIEVNNSIYEVLTNHSNKNVEEKTDMIEEAIKDLGARMDRDTIKSIVVEHSLKH